MNEYNKGNMKQPLHMPARFVNNEKKSTVYIQVTK